MSIEICDIYAYNFMICTSVRDDNEDNPLARVDYRKPYSN